MVPNFQRSCIAFVLPHMFGARRLLVPWLLLETGNCLCKSVHSLENHVPYLKKIVVLFCWLNKDTSWFFFSLVICRMFEVFKHERALSNDTTLWWSIYWNFLLIVATYNLRVVGVMWLSGIELRVNVILSSAWVLSKSLSLYVYHIFLFPCTRIIVKLAQNYI